MFSGGFDGGLVKWEHDFATGQLHANASHEDPEDLLAALGAAAWVAAAILAPEIVLPVTGFVAVASACGEDDETVALVAQDAAKPETAAPAPQPAPAAPVAPRTYFNPEDSYCKVIQNDIQINARMTNASFRSLLSLWGREKGLTADNAIDWTMTQSWTGPFTMDNVCHVDKWYTWADGTYFTPERVPVNVNIESRYAGEQKQIFDILTLSGVTTWHPDVLDYVGEYSNIAQARWSFAAEANTNVDAYIAAVQEAFKKFGATTCGTITSATFPIDYFLAAVAPVEGLNETQVKAALTALSSTVKFQDNQMADIVMAAWYVRAANSSQATGQAEYANTYIARARDALAKLFSSCALPEQRPSDAVMNVYLGFISDPERRELVQWIMNSIYGFVPAEPVATEPTPPVTPPVRPTTPRTCPPGEHRDHGHCVPNQQTQPTEPTQPTQAACREIRVRPTEIGGPADMAYGAPDDGIACIPR